MESNSNPAGAGPPVPAARAVRRIPGGFDMTAFRRRVSQARILSFALLGALAAGGALVAHDSETEAGTLVGVWESVAPLGLDCQTQEPYGPLIQSAIRFINGTMSEQNTDPIKGPYRTPAPGYGNRRRTARTQPSRTLWLRSAQQRAQRDRQSSNTDPAQSRRQVVHGERHVRSVRRRRQPLLDPSGAPIAGCFPRRRTG